MDTSDTAAGTPHSAHAAGLPVVETAPGRPAPFVVTVESGHRSARVVTLDDLAALARRHLPRQASPDRTALELTAADLSRKVDELRREVEDRNTRLRDMTRSIVAREERIAALEARNRELEAALAPARPEVQGDPGWTAPASLLPRGMR